MAEQAYAYVTLIPVAKGFQAKAAQELSGLGGMGGGLGDQAAKGFSQGFGATLKKLIGPAALLGAGIAVSNFVSGAIKGGSNLQAEFEGVNQVFKESASTIQAFAKSAASTAGLTEVEALRASKTMGLFAQSAGLGGQASAKFSTDLVQLAGDLGSFNDIPTGDALAAIQSGLQGQAEPLRRFGVFLTEDALKAEAMAMGLYNGTGALDAQTKMLASYNLIMKSTTTQQGDFVKYATDFGNAQKTMNANFENMRNTLGTSLLPVLGQLMVAMNPIITMLGPMLFNVFQKLIPVFEMVATTITKLTPALDPIIEAFGMLVDVVAEVMRVALPPLLEVFNALLPVLKPLMNLLMVIIKAILPPLAELISKVLVPVLVFVVDILTKYLIPYWTALAKLFGGALKIAVDVVIGAFQLLVKILKPVWDFVKPIIEGFMALAGIKPIKLKVETSGVDTTSLAGIMAASGTKAPSLAGNLDLSNLSASKAATTASKTKVAADLKKAREAMIKSFQNDVLKNIGPDMFKDVESLTKFGEGVADFLAKGLENKTITKKTADAANALVKTYTGLLTPIITEHNAVVAKLADAQDYLTRKIEEKLQYVETITEKFGSKLAIDEKTTAQSAIAQLKERLSRTKELSKAMAELQKLGLSGDLYQQILDSGNLELAQSIIAGGNAAVSELNDLAAAANETALGLAQDAANILFDKGIEVAQGVVDGLKAKQDELAALMVKMAQAFGDELDAIITGNTSKLGNTQAVAPFRFIPDYGPSKPEIFTGPNASGYATQPTTTIVYNAAPNQSLDAEAALQTAIDRSGLLV